MSEDTSTGAKIQGGASSAFGRLEERSSAEGAEQRRNLRRRLADEESLAVADAHWMRHALALAEASIGLASPNPRVGCVIVRDGLLVGQGAHIYDSMDHAEVVALKEAGASAPGATAYVTLEPCSHTGRTGPCAEALIRAQVSRVVVATGDPNPLVNGRGIEQLLAAGVEVAVGVLSEPARALNDGFACAMRTGLPFVTLKAGLSLDGRIAPAASLEKVSGAGSTTYLTSPHSLVAVHRMRHASDAMLMGIGTVLHDNPLMTDRSGSKRRRPLLRVVLDTHLRLPVQSRLVESAAGDVLVYTAQADSARAEELRAAGVLVEQVALDEHGSLDLRAALGSLHRERQVLNVLVEGGSYLNRAILEQELAGKLVLFYAPIFLGDQGVPLLAGAAALHPEFQRSSLTPSSDDFRFEGYLRDPWL